jgi:hypothetical protein
LRSYDRILIYALYELRRPLFVILLGRSPKLSAEKAVLPWEPVASEIQPCLSGSREWWLGNLALAQRVDYKNFWGKAKKGFRFALKPVTIWRLASFDRPVFDGATLVQNH